MESRFHRIVFKVSVRKRFPLRQPQPRERRHASYRRLVRPLRCQVWRQALRSSRRPRKNMVIVTKGRFFCYITYLKIPHWLQSLVRDSIVSHRRDNPLCDVSCLLFSHGADAQSIIAFLWVRFRIPPPIKLVTIISSIKHVCIKIINVLTTACCSIIV